MASFDELERDWFTLCEGSPDEWTITDLHLAAELGKTLLERNKELENSLKHQQNVIEDQSQEIEYLTKQTVALREVNDSRLRIYEQLEVNIQDLERANHRLAVENASDKKHIKSLTANIETLETKCEQLQSNIDDLTLQLEVERRKSQRTQHFAQRQMVSYTGFTTSTNKHNDIIAELVPKDDDDGLDCSRIKTEDRVSSKSDRCQETQTTPKKDDITEDSKELEQISQLMSQLREKETQCARDQRRITEVEEQLEIMQEQNKILERQLSQYHMKDEEIKSVQDELSSLEEVRLGLLCSKCLGTMNGDDMSLSACDDDDSSMFEALNERSQFRTSYSIDVQDYNTSTPTSQNNTLYQDLVQKYQALLEVHRIPKNNKQPNSLSLQDELQMSGDFTNQNTKDTDEESGNCDCLKEKQNQKSSRKTFSRTPTDFSEAETSSSGFCDETFSKATQTDEMRIKPGSFLCTIGDGNDCIRIYDDTTSPIESRFRNRPEYRELFKEIFGVLNKASKNKTEDEALPVLDDEDSKIPKVPPVTPCIEQLPDFPDNLTDDTQSVFSSSSQQEVTLVENPPTIDQKEPETKSQQQQQPPQPQERVLTPLIRQPLESISVQVNVRKRSSSRKKKPYAERSDSPVTHIVGSPKVTYSNRHTSGRRRKENRDIWKGNTTIYYNRNMQTPSPNPERGGYKLEHALEFKPSPASQELHKLKTLDRTYADVLRKSDKNGMGPWRRQN